MSLSQAIDAACAALIARGGTPDSLELSQETWDARYPDLVEAVGFDPPSFYYYQGTLQLGFNILADVPPMNIRVGGTTRIAETVEG